MSVPTSCAPRLHPSSDEHHIRIKIPPTKSLTSHDCRTSFELRRRQSDAINCAVVSRVLAVSLSFAITASLARAHAHCKGTPGNPGVADGAFTPIIWTIHVDPIWTRTKIYRPTNGSSWNIPEGWWNDSIIPGGNPFVSNCFSAGFQFKNPAGHACSSLRVKQTRCNGDIDWFDVDPPPLGYFKISASTSGQLNPSCAAEGTGSVELHCSDSAYSCCGCLCASASMTIKKVP